MKTPDFTPAQIAAYVVALAGMVAALAGVDLSDGQKAAILAGVPAVIALFHLVSDAVVRNGRSRALAPVQPAASPTVNVQQAPPVTATLATTEAPQAFDLGHPYGDTEPEPAELPAEGDALPDAGV